MNIFLDCDNNVEIDNPDFKFNGESNNFVYVSKHVCVCIHHIIVFQSNICLDILSLSAEYN